MTITEVGFAVVGVSILVGLYTYFGYPALLYLVGAVRGASPVPDEEPEEWPLVSISVAMYNEEAHAPGLVENLLALEYPADRRQILIVSDGSTDRTNEIVSGYADRGVTLVALPTREGKTACENAVAERLEGEIVVNTDASIRLRPDALRHLIPPFSDPEIGLTTGRDVSVGSEADAQNVGESGYVGYEMAVRDLETRLRGIVGASGSLYAIRKPLHVIPVPPALSRDFSAALKCQDHGFRAVSTPRAICVVPRGTSIAREFSRKVRTMTRGMQTLKHWRRLLNPFRHGVFSWMLFSHKICRWAVPWFVVLGGIGLLLLSVELMWARVAAAFGVIAVAVGVLGWITGDAWKAPKPVRLLAFAVMGNVAAMRAFLRSLGGGADAIWEPTVRRKGAGSATG